MKMPHVRSVSAQIIYQVVFKKENLKRLFQSKLTHNISAEHASAIKSLCYETIRHYLYYQDLWLQQLSKNPKDKLVCVLMTQALVEVYVLKKPEHAVVNETINTAKLLRKNWANALINSTLRKAIVSEVQLVKTDEARYNHPQWWIDKIKRDWPKDFKQILKANNEKPPLWVRCTKVNQKLNIEYAHPYIKSAFILETQDITQLDIFNSGAISVQDASAQLAAHILNPKGQEKILDACAAPGGKTCHILELNDAIELDALEFYPNRLEKIKQNLERINKSANLILGDAKKPDQWFKKPSYDKILLDVPCSASGIIRRQSDIKFIRQKHELQQICEEQKGILQSVSKLLKPKGRLLYATCSIFPEENSLQIKEFLDSNSQFREIKLKYKFATNCEFGVQILPSTLNMDGFYYCLLERMN